jgi:hypothetical protein
MWRRTLMSVAISLAPTVATDAQSQGAVLVDVRVHTLKAGARDQFHARFVAESLPLLHAAGIDVVSEQEIRDLIDR